MCSWQTLLVPFSKVKRTHFQKITLTRLSHNLLLKVEIILSSKKKKREKKKRKRKDPKVRILKLGYISFGDHDKM